ncbi:MAG: endonuclease/exonuclease/phosphatase family protein, partial [Planctomycetaceae bacterium]
KKYRNAVLSVIDLPSGSVRILSVHLDRRRDRRRQLEAVTRLFLSLEPPAVLMGDLNTTRSDEVLKRTLQHPEVTDVLADTEFEDDPRRIDWMLVRGLRCRNAELIDNRSSDHPVIRAELEWTSRMNISEHHVGKH